MQHRDPARQGRVIQIRVLLGVVVLLPSGDRARRGRQSGHRRRHPLRPGPRFARDPEQIVGADLHTPQEAPQFLTRPVGDQNQAYEECARHGDDDEAAKHRQRVQVGPHHHGEEEGEEPEEAQCTPRGP
ncbi:hypothetical protein [Gordonia sp. C13]|uniref:hypothetical protein n=1 Tax=Gordonia sp. C13 TaxID=2935078 RepID=UPI00200A1D21|nr:hypothetical protein [Gordonia sp. C13]MCK8612859.1 hypothetical protein [Gordonia sp. C13]